MIPIPTGQTHIASVKGQAEKHVACQSCSREFVYILERTARAGAFNFLDLRSDRAVSATAVQRAESRLAAVLLEQDLVACPGCGWLQPSMVREIRGRRLSAILKVFGTLVPGPLILLAMFLGYAGNFFGLGMLLAAAAIGFAAVLVNGCTWDPNANSPALTEKKRLGIRVGTPLAEFRAMTAQQRLRADAEEVKAAELASRLEVPTHAPKVDETAFQFLSNRPSVAANSRLPQKRKLSDRHVALLAICLASVGAAIGGLIESVLSRFPQAQVFDRSLIALIVAPVAGYLAYLTAERTIKTQLIPGGTISSGAAAGIGHALHLNPQALAGGIGLTWGCVISAVLAAGFIRATVRGYALVVLFQASLSLLFWLWRRSENQGFLTS